MSMYKGKKKFTRKQVLFMVEAALSAACDRADSCLPSAVSVEEYEKHKDSIESYISGAIETAGMNIAIIYAQLTGDGIGIGDAISLIKFDKVIKKFIKSRIKNGEQKNDYPNCKKLAKQYVEFVFDDYFTEFDPKKIEMNS